ncbi:MAG: SprT family zinc-dependent metalloprotease, partial [Candidatus Fermentibacteria bacterium]|nr:SprT family zinc-dependent metalloprotease [Candidatus Fermentibacteria bacterium]
LEERKTIAATVYPNSELLVKAPVDATPDGIESFLLRKLRWILKQKRFFAQFKNSNEKQYVSGETFQYRGRSYKLLLHGNCISERVSLQHGVLNVFLAGAKDSSAARLLVENWYTKSALRVFPERVRVCSALFDFPQAPVPSAILRKMNKRWGSYSKKLNRITLNRELIRVATRFIDYVIIHELCHVSNEKHNAEFYTLLESKLPNWRQLKIELELYLLGSN